MIRILIMSLLVIPHSLGVDHKDRLSTIVQVAIHTTDQQFLRFDRKDSIQLRTIADGLSRDRKVQKVKVLFSTGEIAQFRGDGVHWKEITIHSGKIKLVVPIEILSKIQEIHFDDMFLLWSGEKQTAFKSEYLNLVFASGSQKVHGRFPKIQLTCLNLTKWIPERATPINDNGIQYTPL